MRRPEKKLAKKMTILKVVFYLCPPHLGHEQTQDAEDLNPVAEGMVEQRRVPHSLGGVELSQKNNFFAATT